MTLSPAYVEGRRRADRRDAIRLLVRERPLTAWEIAQALGISRWSVVGFLVSLESARLVRRRGRVTRGPRGGRHTETEWLA